jgi:hypothetical protein
MRFQITLNMPSRAGNPVHQIIGDHPIDSFVDFVDLLNNKDFVLVDEIYKDNDGGKLANYYSVGPIAINTAFIGKIKVHVP